MGPNASLNDILNFDFAGRHASKYPPNSKAEDINQNPQPEANRPSQRKISPIFEVLIKLRQGREQAREKVGEKHIAIEQVPSK